MSNPVNTEMGDRLQVYHLCT